MIITDYIKEITKWLFQFIIKLILFVIAGRSCSRCEYGGKWSGRRYCNFHINGKARECLWDIRRPYFRRKKVSGWWRG